MNPQTNPLSHYFAIWIKPRGTIRHILDTNPQQQVLLLAALSGVYRALDRASENGFGDRLSLIPLLAGSIIGGGLAGVMWLYLGGAFFRWVGSWLGGQADSEEVRAAIAWSSVPDLVLLASYIPLIVIFGHNLFSSSAEWMTPTVVIAMLAIYAPIGLVLLVWRAFLFVKCLAEAHRFSAWKGLGTAILGIVIIIVPLFIVLVMLGR